LVGDDDSGPDESRMIWILSAEHHQGLACGSH